MKLFSRTIILSAILSSSIFFTNCSKDRNTEKELELEETTTETPEDKEEPKITTVFSKSSADNTIARLAKKSSSKKASSYSDLPIKGSEGTEIWAYNYLFVDKNGRGVSYPIDFEILELYTPKDMILNNVPTTSNGEILVSGGEFKITATKNGEEVFLASEITINVPTTAPDNNMQLFLGTETNGTVNWNAGPTFVQTIDSLLGSTQTPTLTVLKDSYSILTKNLNWINCDYFYRNMIGAPKTTITFTTTTEGLDINNLAKYVYLPEINSVIGVYGEKSAEIPTGLKAQVVCLTADTDSNAWAYISKEFTITADHKIDFEVTKMSDSELLEALDLLGK